MRFINAVTFGYMSPRDFSRGLQWRESLKTMAAETGCDTVVLAVAALQEHAYSTQVDYLTDDVMGEEDIRAVCTFSKQLGLRIILKAMVNCRDGYWRAYIRFFDNHVPTEPSWKEWFESYGRFVLAMAHAAQEAGAEMFCVGCEMVGTDHREHEWRSLLRAVRRQYQGLITYNCDKYQEERVRWWDAVDVISSSGYYPIDALKENFSRIRKVAEKAGKPFMFMESGCPSREGSEYLPNDWRFSGRQSLQAQARWYRAVTEEMIWNPWIRGIAWWDWSADRLYSKEKAQSDNGYCVYGKPAAMVVKAFSRQIFGRETGLKAGEAEA